MLIRICLCRLQQEVVDSQSQAKQVAVASQARGAASVAETAKQERESLLQEVARRDEMLAVQQRELHRAQLEMDRCGLLYPGRYH